MIALGQDAVTATYSQEYITPLTIGMFGMMQFETYRRYLQAMGIFQVTMFIQLFTLIVHIIVGYTLIFVFEFGVKGAAYATIVTYWLDFIIVVLYIKFKTGLVHEESWHFYNSDSFIGLWDYLKLAVPSAMMLCLEWWVFEGVSIEAGWLSTEELGAYIVLFNLITLLFQVPLGLSFALNSFVGNSMGDNKPKTAKRYFQISILISLV